MNPASVGTLTLKVRVRIWCTAVYRTGLDGGGAGGTGLGFGVSPLTLRPGGGGGGGSGLVIGHLLFRQEKRN